MSNHKSGSIITSSTQTGSAPNHSNLHFNFGDFAIDAGWICNAGQGGPIVTKHDSTLGWIVQILPSGRLQFVFNCSIYVSAVTGLDDGNAHYAQISINRTVGKAYIFIDGEIDGLLDISTERVADTLAPLTVGFYGTTYHTGSICEIRISNIVRNLEAFVQDIKQLSDDGCTVALYHFNEGGGLIAYDSSTTRNHLTITNINMWLEGPLLFSPASVVRDRVWLIFDSYTPLNTFLRARNGKKHRYRPNDPIPGTPWSQQDCPALVVVPLSGNELESQTSAFHGIPIQVTVEGHIFGKDPSEVEFFWWLCTLGVFAYFNRSSTTAGRANWTQIEHIKDLGPIFNVQETDKNTLFSSFMTTYLFETRMDILN